MKNDRNQWVDQTVDQTVQQVTQASHETSQLNRAIGETLDTLPPDVESARRSLHSVGENLGRYKIIKLLGKGGMGAVFLAHDPTLDRKVAIKIPFLNATNSEAVLNRFEREARAVAALHHPNICPVYEVTEARGIHFMVIAFIEGRPLSDYLKEAKRFKVTSAVNLVRKLALTLDEAHRKGVIHRDLKPANIMIDARNEPQIMDFGLARLDNIEASRLTAMGQILGTPAYMPPEQVNGITNAVGPASDIYSLGVMLYEMITGELPLNGDLMSLMFKIANETPAPASSHREGIPEWLDKVCAKAMAKKPEQRFSNMKAFADALKTGSALPIKSTPQVEAVAATVIRGSTQPNHSIGIDLAQGRSSVSHSGRGRNGNRFVWLAAAAAFPLILLAGGWIIKITKSDGTVQEVVVANDSKVEMIAKEFGSPATAPMDPLAQSPKINSARAAAEEVLKAKEKSSVTIQINGTDLFDRVTDAAKLPTEPFTITEVTLAGENGNELAVAMLAELGTVTHLLTEGEKALSRNALENLPKINSLRWIMFSPAFLVNDDIFSGLKSIPRLDNLCCWYNSVTDRGLEQLDQFPELRSIYLGAGPYTGVGLKALMPMPLVNEISFNISKFSDESIAYLDRFPRVDLLDLRECNITSNGLRSLPTLALLTTLNLSNNQRIDDDCLTSLKRLPSLKHLKLSQTGISDAGLVELGSWMGLESLELIECNLTPEAIDQLRNSLPNCNIVTVAQP